MNRVITGILFLIIIATLANAQQESSIKITDPWIRPAAESSNTALFFIVENKSNTPDTLIAAKSSLAQVIEVHETFKKGDMMGMREVKAVPIPPNSKVQFKPRDLHVMLIKLNKDMKVKDEGEVTLVFKNAGEIKVKAVVRDMPARGGMKH